jgi:hypothetical protein
MKERSSSSKQAVNQAASTGLTAKDRAGTARFQQRTFRMGSSQESSLDKALALAESMEDEELARKVALRK